MIELHNDNYHQEVKNAKGIFVVDFWSESCEDCVEMMPEIEALAEEFKGRIKMGKVDLKGNRRLTLAEGVRGLPALLIYKDGEKQELFSKEFDTDEVKAKIEELLSE